MSIAEQMVQKGRKEGLQEGLQKGLQEGREEGTLMGQVRLMQELLGVRITPLANLSSKSPSELRKLAAELRGRLRKRGI